MKKLVFSALCLLSAAMPAGIVAYQATAKNTPQAGYAGQVLCVQACSTNATGTATVSAVTDLSVNGNLVSFTNTLASVTLVGGVGQVSPTNTFVASRQRIIVSGDAFPGGSAIVWLQQ